MKNKIWLWIIKILAIFVWLTTLFIPDIFEKIENVYVVNYKEIKVEEKTESLKTIEVEFSEIVLYGHVFIELYDESGKVLYGSVILFEEDNSRFAEIEIEYENLSECAEYRIKGAYVKTKNELIVDRISTVAFVVMFAVMIVIIRIDYEEKVVGGKTVTVYSGIIKHRVKIDGKTVFDKKWFTFKGREVVLTVGEKSDIKVLFDAMNKIKFETIDKAENSADNNSHKNDNDEENNK